MFAHRRAIRPLSAIALSLLISSGSLFAQSERGTIAGNVVDPSGAAIAGAKVSVVNAATNVASTTATNETGAYAVPGLSPAD